MASPHLLGLPLELRHEIFGYLDRDAATFTWPFDFYDGYYMLINVTMSGYPQASMLRTNKQLRREYIDLGCYDAVLATFCFTRRTASTKQRLQAGLRHAYRNPLEGEVDLNWAANKKRSVQRALTHARHINITDGGRHAVLTGGVVGGVQNAGWLGGAHELWSAIEPFSKFLEYENDYTSILTLSVVVSSVYLYPPRHAAVPLVVERIKEFKQLAKAAPNNFLTAFLDLPLLHHQYGVQVGFGMCYPYSYIERLEEEPDEDPVTFRFKVDELEEEFGQIHIVPGARHEAFHEIQEFATYTYAVEEPSRALRNRVPLPALNQLEEYPDEVWDVLSEEDKEDIANWRVQYWPEEKSIATQLEDRAEHARRMKLQDDYGHLSGDYAQW